MIRAALGRAVAPISWLVLLGGCAALASFALRPYRVGPGQPIPFSHRVHAGDKQISCLFCHDAADRSQDAGMPAVGKCLLCHNVIIPNFAPVQQLHGYYDRGQPVPWVRVYRLNDFVFFDHEMHIRRNIDCGHCHGNVKGMDRIILNEKLEMGFCVDCHRRPEYKASVDCWFCHR